MKTRGKKLGRWVSIHQGGETKKGGETEMGFRDNGVSPKLATVEAQGQTHTLYLSFSFHKLIERNRALTNWSNIFSKLNQKVGVQTQTLYLSFLFSQTD